MQIFYSTFVRKKITILNMSSSNCNTHSTVHKKCKIKNKTKNKKIYSEVRNRVTSATEELCTTVLNHHLQLLLKGNKQI